MSSFLIKAIDAVHPDSEKDRRGCYKKGYLVESMPNGAVWGKKQGLPKFIVVVVMVSFNIAFFS